MGLGQRERRGFTEAEAAEIAATRQEADRRHEAVQEAHAELAAEAAAHGYGQDVQNLGTGALRQLQANGWEMTAELAEDFFE